MAHEYFWILVGFGIFFLFGALGIAAITWAERQGPKP